MRRFGFLSHSQHARRDFGPPGPGAAQRHSMDVSSNNFRFILAAGGWCVWEREDMAKAVSNLVKAIQASEDSELSWAKCMAESESKLLVVDCHKDWCGPCETLHPTLQRIFLETPDCDGRCQFLAANVDEFASNVEAILTKDSPVNVAKQGCMPFFLLVRAGAVVATVNGANAPAILQEVARHMPEPPTKEDAEQ